jgi:hypothetical protein
MEKVIIEIAQSKTHVFGIVMRGQAVLHGIAADRNDVAAVEQMTADVMFWAMDNTDYIPGNN